MSSANQLEQLMAEVRHYRERMSLLRARVYSGKPSSDARLREFERSLQSAERRLREARGLDRR
jgi:prefoldin subunit 5